MFVIIGLFYKKFNLLYLVIRKGKIYEKIYNFWFSAIPY